MFIGSVEITMKIALFIVGGLLILIGCVWILQGFNILQGSMMSGHRRYALLGAGAAVVGIVLAIVAARMRKKA